MKFPIILQDRFYDLWRKRMSKICEKCGNVIPDGSDICPNCGREDYDDHVLQDVLEELGISLDDDLAEALEAAEDSAEIPVFEDVLEDTSAEIPSPGTEEPEDSDVTMVFETAKVRKAAKAQREEKATASGKSPKARKADKAGKESGKGADKGGKKPGRADNAPQGQKKRPSQLQQKPRQQEPEEDEPQPMKRRSAAVIGVLIGLLTALLLIAGGIGIMLFRMGFFNSMSDEELLGTATATPAVTATASPEVSAVVSETASPSPEVVTTEGSTVEETPEPSKEPIELDQFQVTGASTIYLYSRGETSKVSYIITPSSAASEIEWSSDDETVATVDGTGTIRARRGGICTVKGECGGTFIAVTVVCSFEVPDTVLDMNMEDITMNYEGQTAQLAIDYELTAAQEKATVWESSDPSVATVDDSGLVTAVADGTAVISASIADYTASCIVRCVDVTGSKGYNSDDSEYVINYTDVTLSRKGEYFQLTLSSVLGKEVPSFTWSSDDTEVATVDSKGVVTAVSNGTAYITASIGSDQFRCIVRVNIS